MSNLRKSKKVHIDGVGEVHVVRSTRAKRVGLTIEPFKGIRLTIPKGVPTEQAMGFLQSKRDSHCRHQPRIAQIEADSSTFTTNVPINRKVARRVIVDRLDQLAKRHGFAYNRVFVRNQKTRWGSCSAANNISLNIQLIRLPAALMDYTIVHELVHTRIKNHGPEFWRLLEECIPQARQMDRQLNGYGPMLLT